VTDNPRSGFVGRKFSKLLWLLGLVFAVVSAWAITQSSHAQQGAADLPPDRAMWAALAHGNRTEAERLASERPGDPTAAAVRGRLALDRGDHAAALSILEPVASSEPLSDAALELGLLYRRLGGRTMPRGCSARSTTAPSSSDPAAAVRAGRAAQVLNRPREANSLFRVAANLAPTPDAESAWGALFLERHDLAEAAKSFQQALEAR
jgi:tetratricopeptide (TPR) repeat protein